MLLAIGTQNSNNCFQNLKITSGMLIMYQGHDHHQVPLKPDVLLLGGNSAILRCSVPILIDSLPLCFQLLQQVAKFWFLFFRFKPLITMLYNLLIRLAALY